MTIGENIRLTRKEKRLTQKELGALCGINEAQLRRYELGGKNSKPKLETLQKIAYALKIDVMYLLCSDENDIRITNLQNSKHPELIPEYAKLPEPDYSNGWEDWLRNNGLDLIYLDFATDLDDEEYLMLKFLDTKEIYCFTPNQYEYLQKLSIEKVKTLICAIGEKYERTSTDKENK